MRTRWWWATRRCASVTAARCRRRPSSSLTHSLTLSLTHSLTHSLTLSLSVLAGLSPLMGLLQCEDEVVVGNTALCLSHCCQVQTAATQLTHSLSHSLTLSLTHSLSHSLTHSLSHSLSLSRCCQGCLR